MYITSSVHEKKFNIYEHVIYICAYVLHFSHSVNVRYIPYFPGINFNQFFFTCQRHDQRVFRCSFLRCFWASNKHTCIFVEISEIGHLSHAKKKDKLF